MKLVTAPSRTTLDRLGLDPGARLGSAVPGDSRRLSMLAFHLNRWVLAKTGGSADRPWLGTVSGFGGYPLAEFRHQLARWNRSLTESSSPDPECFGWEFLLTASAWSSSREIESITVVHSGFEQEIRQLVEETGLPAPLAEPLLRSWLQSLYRCTSSCEVLLISLHESDDLAKLDPGELRNRAATATELAETELNAADSLPPGNWRLRKGAWEAVASAEDLEVIDAMRHLGNPPLFEVERALAHGRNLTQRAIAVSPQTYRDARNIELRGIDRIQKERNMRNAGRDRTKQSPPGGRGSFQVSRAFGSLLKRIFSGKRSS